MEAHRIDFLRGSTRKFAEYPFFGATCGDFGILSNATRRFRDIITHDSEQDGAASQIRPDKPQTGWRTHVFYKPKFCCECGEKVERAEWTFAHSRRFCDVCQTDFLLVDWLPRAVGAVVTIVGLFGIGVFIGAPVQKPSALITSRPSPAPSNRNTRSDATLLPPAKSGDSNRLPEKTPVSSGETIEICGAITKKGTPCTRRVKGGGRCWQHRGEPAAGSKKNAAP